ncbi:MAG: PEP-CTERM system histidine kinase PrsK [Desulfuromonadales bacterium]|nr:PEP-CTERM system histidine kinase PrsK [Desulfuromonadales bacterium]
MGQNSILILSLCAVSLLAGTSIYLLLRPPSSHREWPLVMALLLTAAIELLDLFLIQNPENLLKIKPFVFVCEAMLPASWVLYASFKSRGSLRKRPIPGGLFWTGGVILLALALIPDLHTLIFSPDFGSEYLLFLGPTGFFFYFLISVYLLVALVMLERSYAALARRDRWCMKFELLGIGSIMAMQLIYYNQALLYRTLDMTLVPARLAAIVLGLMLFLFARLRRRYPVRLTLSPAAAFHSIILVVVFGYLVFVGLVGEGLRYLGPAFSRALLLSLSLFSGVALLLLLLSESMRRKTKVFLHKNFYEQKYDYRLLWMKMTSRLTTARDVESLYTVIVEIYCQTFAVLGGGLYLAQSKETLLTAVAVNSGGKMPDRIDLQSSLGIFLKTKQWVLNLTENAAELSDADSQLLKRHDIEFIVPIFFGEELGGVVALCRRINTDEPVIYEDYDLMKIFSHQVAAVLFNERLSRQLAEQREMAAVGKVSAFVMHDLKNLGSILSLMVENGRELITDRRFQDDMIETLASTVGQMNSLIGRLKNIGESNLLVCEVYNLKRLVTETLAEINSDRVRLSGADVEVMIDRNEIKKVVTNLILNAIEASGRGGSITVEICNETGPLLICRDHGCGMSADFIAENLFRPFASTKEGGLGIGLYHCCQIVEAHGGRIEVDSAIGKGSEFRVYLPSILTAEV